VFAESFSISSRFAHQHGYEVDADQEMVAMGAANASAGLFQGFAVSGSASRTAAVGGAGGGSQMVSLLAAALVLVTAAFLTPLFTDLPEPVLGAIVIVAVRGFLRTEPLRRYWRLDRRSFWVATTALLGTLVFDLLPGLLIAVGLSLVWFIGAASRPRLAVLGQLGGGRYGDLLDHPEAATVPGLLLVRPDGPVFFANANPLRLGVLRLVRTASPPLQVVVVDLSSSFRLCADHRRLVRAPRRAGPGRDRAVAGPDPQHRHGGTPGQWPGRPARTGPAARRPRRRRRSLHQHQSASPSELSP
jgi:SulP family sulfate permease